MRTRLLPFALTLLALTAARPAGAADDKPAKSAKPAKPTVVVRLAPIDSLIADAQYLAEIVDKGEEAKQAEGFLKAMTDDKGLLGIDTTKPIGLYGYLGPGGVDSEVVVLVPIKDEKSFIERLGGFGIKFDKAADDTWKYDVEKFNMPVYFRFANGYLYATVREPDPIKKDRLLDPATVLVGGGTASAVINLDGIPKELKEIALTQSELQMANAKDKEMPNETKAQKAFRHAVLDETFARLKQLLNEGGPLAVRLDVDRKAGDLNVSASLAGKPDSKLAQNIADLAKTASSAAGILPDNAALSLWVDAAMPARVREALGPVVEEVSQQAIEKEKDKDDGNAKLAESMLKAIAPTLKAGELDAGFNLVGPDADGLYTFLVAARVKDGNALDAAFKNAVKDSHPKVQGALTLDIAKVGDVNIHKAVPDKVDDNTRNTLGDNPIYFAFRNDVVLVAGGPKGLDTIKAAAAKTATAGAGKLFQMDIALAKTAKLGTDDNKNAPAVAKKVFKGGDDTIHIVLEGGATLKLSLSMKTRIIQFFNELEQAKHKS